ncbi:hypothetical protein O9G_005013 [Rozella allomycis CSF55]|uniref:DWNN-domain-containing protein n=1 Tax=Rozella allomycis (strain CSF55) TaxID=988480 RepID=A0A075B3D3_ROZAC|nr:hypothetical protein O9G_005013 [Rozella allomycis CSF55]|eukprot:EPZ35476.1 hypothetical protein O9G_005013 [Rozella allomycis CSF55]
MSTIHYKFKSAKGFDKITFDGTGITIYDLKKEIIQQKKLVKSGYMDFDLIISDAQSKEVVAKNSLVIVRRVPLNAVKKQKIQPVVASKVFFSVNSTENDKIAAMVESSFLQWDKQIEDNSALSMQLNKQRKAKVITKEPPPNYICYRCGQKGHFIHQCPTNSDKSFDLLKVKRTTGFLKTVDASEIDKANGTVMVTDDGSLVVVQANTMDDTENILNSNLGELLENAEDYETKYLAEKQVVTSFALEDTVNMSATSMIPTSPLSRHLPDWNMHSPALSSFTSPTQETAIFGPLNINGNPISGFARTRTQTSPGKDWKAPGNPRNRTVSALGMTWNTNNNIWPDSTSLLYDRRFSLAITPSSNSNVSDDNKQRSRSKSQSFPVNNHPWEEPGAHLKTVWEGENTSNDEQNFAMPSIASTPSLKTLQPRFSYSTPSMDSPNPRIMVQNRDNEELQRRHSVAESLLFGGIQNDAIDKIENLSLSERNTQKINMDAIDEYFSGEARSRANSDSKSRPFNPATNNGPIFVVEFKAGRTDFFFIPEAEEKFASSGDLVIVEADRGKIVEEITYETFLEQSQSLSNLNVGSDGENVSTVAVSPKIIYRLADADDVSQLQAKALDEQKAMAVCQAKVRQKKLPMEVVDAEYQW